MRSTTARTPAESLWQPPRATDARPHPHTRGEQGRRAILVGWIVTMLGIAGYIVAMSRAGANADIFDGLIGQGPLGWISGALMLTGVVTWFIGNYACLQELSDIPAGTDD
ncbi:MAG TPA: hypothetical protein VNT02_11685 [Burkholderiales bacterium]|nr:hypothetical protein [Burkholderiales bacterium]